MRAHRTAIVAAGIAIIAVFAGWLQSNVVEAGHAPANSREGDGSLSRFAAALSKRFDTNVLIDPEIVIVGDAVHVDGSTVIESALDQLTHQVPNTAWRRVYTIEKDRARGAAALSAAVRAVERVDVLSIRLEEPATHRMIELQTDVPTSRSFRELLVAGQYQLKPTYLVYKAVSSSDGMTAQERASADEQELAALLEIAPGLRSQAVRQSMTWWMKLDPGSLQPLMQRLGSVGTELWSSVEPSQRQEMMEKFKQNASTALSAAGGPGTGNAASADAAGRRNYLDELERIARDLSARYETVLRVDPAIFLTVRPQAPPQSLDESAAISELMRPLRGIEWARVLLDPRPQTAPMQPQVLADIARSLDLLASGLVVEDVHTMRARVFRVAAASSAPGISAKAARTRINLLYAKFCAESKHPVAPAQRFEELLQRQQQGMLSMDSQQLGRALQQEVQAWQSLDGLGRERLMSLPMAAGLMAVWMPIDAKERSGK